MGTAAAALAGGGHPTASLKRFVSVAVLAHSKALLTLQLPLTRRKRTSPGAPEGRGAGEHSRAFCVTDSTPFDCEVHLQGHIDLRCAYL